MRGFDPLSLVPVLVIAVVGGGLMAAAVLPVLFHPWLLLPSRPTSPIFARSGIPDASCGTRIKAGITITMTTAREITG